MSFDSKSFRQTLGCFATGVTVVTAEVGGQPRGMTANAFSSLSLDPPLVLFCAGKSSHMGQAIHGVPRFGVSMLAAAQQDISNYFAGMWKQPDPPPFSLIEWDGCHRLDGCVAALNCALERILDGGDHSIVVGRVMDVYRSEPAVPPLLFYRGHYAGLSEL